MVIIALRVTIALLEPQLRLSSRALLEHTMTELMFIILFTACPALRVSNVQQVHPQLAAWWSVQSANFVSLALLVPRQTSSAQQELIPSTLRLCLNKIAYLAPLDSIALKPPHHREQPAQQAITVLLALDMVLSTLVPKVLTALQQGLLM